MVRAKADDETLHASLREQTGTLQLDTAPPLDENALDPMPSLLPAEGLDVQTVDTLCARVLGGESLLVSGALGCSVALVAARLARTRPVVLVGADADAAAQLYEDVRFFTGLGREQVLLIAAPDTLPYAEVNPDRRAAMARIAALSALADPGRDVRVVVLDVVALARKVVPSAALRAALVSVQTDTELDRELLASRLARAGYLRVPVVEDPGTFAVRGALVDVWPIDAEQPTRIELFGDMVLSLKRFDPSLQTTHDEVRQLTVPPAREALQDAANEGLVRARLDALLETTNYPTSKARKLLDDVTSGRSFFGADGFLPAYYTELATVFDSLPRDAVFVLEEPAEMARAVRDELGRALAAEAERRELPHFPVSAFYLDEAELLGSLSRHVRLGLAKTAYAGAAELRSLEALGQRPEAAPALDLAALDLTDLGRATKMLQRGKTPLRPLMRRLAHFREHGLRTVLVAKTEVQAERLRALLAHRGVPLGRLTHGLAVQADRERTELAVGRLTRGVVLPAEGLALITEEEIFGARVKKARAKSSRDTKAPFVEDLRSLHVGDYVVHVDHGVGRYLGLSQRVVAGQAIDLITVEYGGGDKLLLPVYRLSQIQKYSGGDHHEPKLDRLGGQSFSKTKARVKKAVREMADELLRLYAERESARGPELGPVDDDYRTFEATFPFEETPDQARAIAEVHGDFERSRPMDRLVCGDVGFGKTEVALRAAFRAALAGKQVAVLCPTTVLAQQHYRTFEARLGHLPISIGILSRFQSKREQDETLRRVKEGKCDVLVGTHRLLSKDVHFKDLALLVVDEEQRFGVTHKERIKHIKKDVHVLTLSATPIPRTLQMAVTGLRDLSLITTPPADRRAVRTVVTRFDDQVIKDAVERELARGGQVFYVYNRVDGLYERAARLQELVPQARIAVGHGQMTRGRKKSGDRESESSETALEQTMLDFVEGRFDVLCATAIVESGLDIPRANTIIVDRADLFGLSQLYQLRGRVGRAKERAYCYLVVPPIDSLSDDARARIEALERHTELGSGFKIASLDLELRGAGDILGGEQSGSVASVGFDLFVSMLGDAVRELRGEEIVHEVDPELSFDVSAVLPDDYIEDVGLRLSFYKRLASAIDADDVQSIAVEMENRFGPPPGDATRFVEMMVMKTELRALRVLGCEASRDKVTLHLREDTPLDSAKILALVHKPKSPWKLTPDMRLTRRYEGESSGLTALGRLLDELGAARKAGA